MTEDRIFEVLVEIRNWVRIGNWGAAKAALEMALPDAKARTAYQMFDGRSSVEQIRIACKMSPNAVVALAARCTSIGLMELGEDKKRRRLFDLADFGLAGDGKAEDGK